MNLFNTFYTTGRHCLKNLPRSVFSYTSTIQISNPYKLQITKNICSFSNSITPTSDKKATESNKPNNELNTEPGVGESQNVVEVEDAKVIFNIVWKRLEKEHGSENLKFPKEIIWLMGAPGSGKSSNAKWIRQLRGYQAKEIVMSDLLADNPKYQEGRKNGMLMPDSDAIQILFSTLLLPQFSNGVIVDGFPRTNLQADVIPLLQEKMLDMRNKFFSTNIGPLFRRPVFRVTVLYIDETESVKRQLNRGQEARAQNTKIQEENLDKASFVEERSTDFSEILARKRYSVFRSHYDSIKELQKHFTFSIISAKPNLEEVRRRIEKEFKYQSSLELGEETFSEISKIPTLEEISRHSRQKLIRRLDNYQNRDTELFSNVIGWMQNAVIPILERNSLLGACQVRTTNEYMIENNDATNMVLDVLSERGYQGSCELIKQQIPINIDLKTGDITCKLRKVRVFNIIWNAKHFREKTRQEEDDADIAELIAETKKSE